MKSTKSMHDLSLSPDELLETARDAARIGGDILIRGFRRLLKHQIKLKGSGDFVTELDHHSEEAIIARIHGPYPDHVIQAEESGEGSGNPRAKWIIDPLDGTSNYVQGLPVFAVSIAVVIEGQTAAGVVYDPCHKEMFWAVQGKGAFLNGDPIRVSQKDALEECFLASGFPWRLKPHLEAYLDSFRELFSLTSGVRRMGSAALDLAHTACGRYDGFWEMKLKPWDIAAGELIVREAGGKVSDFKGGEDFMINGNVLASNALVFERMQEIVKRHLSGVD
jgi:myo-inositol-1(or 4)-monophosphatase